MKKPSDYLREAIDFYEMANTTEIPLQHQSLVVAKAQAAADIAILMLNLPFAAWPEPPEEGAERQ